MGYYNPILRYKESKLFADCKAVGVDGFIVADLPLREAIRFREGCTKTGLSYVSLIAPSTTEDHMKTLCKMADSFIYLVSRMGMAGATGTLNSELPAFIKRVKELSGNVPVTVGFGISTREHFLGETSISDGTITGSQVITVLIGAASGHVGQVIENYCSQITQIKVAQGAPVVVAGQALEASAPSLAVEEEATAATDGSGRFGIFGGQYAPEALIICLDELDASPKLHVMIRLSGPS